METKQVWEQFLEIFNFWEEFYFFWGETKRDVTVLVTRGVLDTLEGSDSWEDQFSQRSQESGHVSAGQFNLAATLLTFSDFPTQHVGPVVGDLWLDVGYLGQLQPGTDVHPWLFQGFLVVEVDVYADQLRDIGCRDRLDVLGSTTQPLWLSVSSVDGVWGELTPGSGLFTGDDLQVVLVAGQEQVRLERVFVVLGDSVLVDVVWLVLWRTDVVLWDIQLRESLTKCLLVDRDEMMDWLHGGVAGSQAGRTAREGTDGGSQRHYL